MNAKTKAIVMSDEPMKGELIIAPQGTQNPAAVFLASRKGLTRSTYLSSLNKIARMIGFDDCFTTPWASFRYAEIASIQSELSAIQKYSTTNRDMSAIKGIMETCWNLDLIDGNAYLKATNTKALRGSSVPAGRDLSSAEIAALITACVGDPKPEIGARDTAILAVMCAPCGIRRSEVVGLNLDDYNPETGEILIRGKGSKERLIYAEQGGIMALNDWIEIRGDLETDALFNPILQKGAIQTRRMSIQAIHNVLKRRGEQARIEPYTPHDLRRSTVGAMLDAGIDMVTVQKVMGHSSPLTTARYDRRPMRAVRDASSKVRFAYAGRPDASGQGKMPL